uniref:Uncharacterized protein n=1 Tax=Arundo donax TaxID=35708 RepID=A0A0A9GD76_ARUDO
MHCEACAEVIRKKILKMKGACLIGCHWISGPFHVYPYISFSCPI